MTYLAKRKRFTCWASEWHIQAEQAPLQEILKLQGLSVSLIKVHLAAISAFHPLFQGRLVFAHNMMAWFLNGLEHVYCLSGILSLAGT